MRLRKRKTVFVFVFFIWFTLTVTFPSKRAIWWPFLVALSATSPVWDLSVTNQIKLYCGLKGTAETAESIRKPWLFQFLTIDGIYVVLQKLKKKPFHVWKKIYKHGISGFYVKLNMCDIFYLVYYLVLIFCLFIEFAFGLKCQNRGAAEPQENILMFLVLIFIFRIVLMIFFW